MGIRIHKMMGYGLTDVTPEDPRINWDSAIFGYDLDDEEDLDLYRDWLSERGKSDIGLSPLLPGATKRRSSIQDCVNFGTSDGGLENVICIRPLAWTDWYRFDDSIDYVEQTASPEGQRDTVQVLETGIYPHISYMDDRVGERISFDDMHPWLWAKRELDRKIAAAAFSFPDDLLRDLEAPLDELAVLGGFSSHKDAMAHYRPHVPDEVRWLCEFSRLFTDPSICLQLRPMVYTWWA